MIIVKSYNGYLIDLDGTVFKGTSVIPSAKEFVEELISRNLPYVFITNNSALSAELLVSRLKTMGITTTKDHILTSSIATAKYIKKTSEDAKCFVIGEAGLRSALKEEVIEITNEDITHVVMGIDREITYEKLALAADHVRKGASFISTNMDLSIPSDYGIKPGNGAFTSVVSLSSGVEPLFMGKPAQNMIDIGLDMLGCSGEEVLLIGDNYFTDIKGGIHAGLDTVFVLTGIGKEVDIQTSSEPTYIFEDLSAYQFKK